MRAISSKRLLAAVPAVVLAVAAAVLTVGALASDAGAAPAPRSESAAAPEGLSPVTTSRDWQEVVVSPSRRSR